MKKNAYIIASVAMALCFSACGEKKSNINDMEPVVAEGTTITTEEEEAVNEEPQADAEVKKVEKGELGRGELGIFELTGPVKSCKWTANKETKTYTFDKNGMWLTMNGTALKKEFYGGIERDNKGRITFGGYDGFGSHHYTYDKRGLVKTFSNEDTDVTYTYNDDGDCIKTKIEIMPDMGDDSGPEIISLTYTILERDDYGNWTLRKDSKGNKETRTLTYYE